MSLFLFVHFFFFVFPFLSFVDDLFFLLVVVVLAMTNKILRGVNMGLLN